MRSISDEIAGPHQHTVTYLRQQIIPESELPPGAEVLDQGRALARDWTVGSSVFLDYYQVSCEAEYKLRCVQSDRIMQHAHMGFRDKQKSLRAFKEIYTETEARGTRIDRFGLCLDWSMGFPRSMRDSQLRGTGLILDRTEDFCEIANAAPAATHFGDFVLGFPAALENTQAALAAGSTIIGNLGQYFTFRLPNWEDDIATTTSTLQAIGLIAAQPVRVMVHSNLDDGFAAVFEDLSSALGAAMLERYIVEDLCGASITHCFGHHYSSPLLRLGFQRALHRVSPNPGSMIYGNTTSYRGTDAQNYASLSGYLLLDILGQSTCPSGHAINPVPVTENRRIPEINEIVDAQVFAARLVNAGREYLPVFDDSETERIAQVLVEKGTGFYHDALNGLKAQGIDTLDPFEMLLAIRRVGCKELEHRFGQGKWDQAAEKHIAIVKSDTVREIEGLVKTTLKSIDQQDTDILNTAGLKLVVAATDVHEHSKMLLQTLFQNIGILVVDGGISADPGDLARIVEQHSADAIALSTYNGVALTYFCRLKDELDEIGTPIPVLIGGQLNEIPEDTDNSLPVSVADQLEQEGAHVCNGVLDAIPILITISNDKASDKATTDRRRRASI
ncbi:MAG: cobalamin-dependent protein [bacterium]